MPFKVNDFGTNQKLICDFLLVMNTNLSPILHCFRNIAFDRSKIAIIVYPCYVSLTRRTGSPGTISVKFSAMSTDGQGTKYHRNIAENVNRLSRVHERYRQQTDRRTGDNI